jgi:hypothetical protein
MKFTNLKSLVFGTALTASSMFANTVFVSQTAFTGGLEGGELKAVTSDNGTFLTFCLEKSVDIVPGQVYSYTIDGNMVLSANDPISQGTAALFLAFSDGTLFNAATPYVGNYADAANHYSNAGLLQLAIWALEDEAVGSQIGNVYYDWALLQGGKSDYAGSEVMVLNPWIVGERQDDVQSLLMRVPDSSTTAVMLGLGLISLAMIRRKR